MYKDIAKAEISTKIWQINVAGILFQISLIFSTTDFEARTVLSLSFL